MARILIIDDNDEFRRTLRMSLEKAGYDIVEASNGNEGIRIYHDKPTDLVIADVIMPEKEGVGTMIELRRDFPDVKIIAISGGGFEEPADYLEGAELVGGAQRVLAKPFTREEMLRTIKELLEEKR